MKITLLFFLLVLSSADCAKPAQLYSCHTYSKISHQLRINNLLYGNTKFSLTPTKVVSLLFFLFFLSLLHAPVLVLLYIDFVKTFVL